MLVYRGGAVTVTVCLFLWLLDPQLRPEDQDGDGGRGKGNLLMASTATLGGSPAEVSTLAYSFRLGR